MPSPRATRHSALAGFAAGGALAVLTFGYFAALAPYGLNVDDEGTLLYQIYRTYLGQLLYVDFHAGYTPGLFYLNAGLFSLFDVNVLVLRYALALINTGTICCMYWLVRRLGASRAAAVTAPLMYVAFIPFYDGQFAAFNIPYPIWYVTFFWLLSIICAVRWWESGRSGLWLPGGLCAGVVFAFKPNSGLLNLAALLIVLTLLERPQRLAPAGYGRLRRLLSIVERFLRWGIPWALTAALSLLFLRGNGWREVRLFALPLIIVVIYQLLLSPGRRMARDVPPFTLWRNLLLLSVGFAVVTLPWTIYFWEQLGTKPFLRAILFIGTGFDKFYFIEYPPIAKWGLEMAAAMGGVLGIGLLVRRRILSSRLVGVGIGVGVLAVGLWLLRHPPPMVEGFQSSVAMRIRDVAFVLVLVTEWVAVAAYLAQTWRGRVFSVSLPLGVPVESVTTAVQRAAPGILVILVVSGTLMHMQLYPRTDFMHLVSAAPGVIILGGWLLDLLAQVWARAMRRTVAGRAAIVAAVIGPVCAVAVILLAPALARIEYVARAWWDQDNTALVHLENRRAPLVIEPAAAAPLRTLASAARYMREHVRPDEFVFTFPALDIVCFLSDRQNPTRHGYFFPGWPGHAVEAEVIDALRARPPRYMVTLHDHAFFFLEAPVYFFNLRRYVTRQYTLDRRIGTLDILRLVEAGGEAPESHDDVGSTLAETIDSWRAELQHEHGAAADQLDDALERLPRRDMTALAEAIAPLQPTEQRLVALLIRKSRSAEGAAALAIVLENYRPLPMLRQLFIRVVAEIGDTRALVPLLGAYAGSAPEQRSEIAGLLYTISRKLSLENYWYGQSDRRTVAAIERLLDTDLLIQWIDNPWELFALRSFAVRIAGRQHDKMVVPFLLRVLGDPNELVDLRVQAAESLRELGYGREILPAIASLLHWDQMTPAAMMVNLYDRDREVGRAALEEDMEDVHEDLRMAAFWIAAAVRDPELLDELQTGLHDNLPEVRIASAWGLGNFGGPDSLAALQQVATDGNDEVATVAQRAALQIKGRE